MNAYSHMSTAAERSMPVSMRIVRLIVMKSGTYNQMYYRPYETHFNADVSEDLARRVHENSSKGGMTTSALMAGVASRLIMPAYQHQGNIIMPNGWEQHRGRFNLVVEMTLGTGTKFYYHMQGYTSHYDLSHGGAPDPEMVFFVNSYSRVTQTTVLTATGAQTREMVTETAQVINGRLVSNLAAGDIYGLRPTDIFGVMQGDMVSSRLYEGYGDAGLGNLVDTRQSLSHKVVPSLRQNNLPANVLSRIVEGFNTQHLLIEYGQGNDDVIGRARGHVFDGALMENGFFRQLSNVSGAPETNQFSLGDLLRLDPNTLHDSITTFVRLDSAGMRELNLASQSETWHRPDMQTWVCSSLVNSVPTLMIELMITSVRFRASNYDAGGRMSMIFEGAQDMVGRDMSPSFAAFALRFEQEIMKDLTQGNQVSYMLMMECNLLGDTVIEISYDGQPITRFVAPSFCDSTFMPVITPMKGNLTAAANDFTQILNSVASANVQRGGGSAIRMDV